MIEFLTIVEILGSFCAFKYSVLLKLKSSGYLIYHSLPFSLNSFLTFLIKCAFPHAELLTGFLFRLDTFLLNSRHCHV